jgi:dipeptidyl aminopeptidase/acylaminoacyl peptidase
VLIVLHAGPDRAFRPGFDPWIQFVVDDLGYAVVAPNLRGSAGLGARFAALDDGPLRGDVVKDLGALLVWIAGRPELDAKRVVVAGRGYGGYLALMAAADYSDRLRGVVDLAGMTDLPTYLDALPPRRQARARGEFGDERDPGVRAFLRNLSPIALADRIDAPALIVHGRNDPIVPLAQAQEMADLLRGHRDRVWLVVANGEGHRFVAQSDRDAIYTAFAQFLLEAR